MLKLKILLIGFILSVSLYSCMTDPSAEEEQKNNKDTLQVSEKDTIANDAVEKIEARFIDFKLGDASHFLFKDAEGNVWDFAGCEEKEYEFAIEIKQDKQNEENQGWITNPELKNKWFQLTFAYRNEPQYPDGPLTRVPVILNAKRIEKK